MSPGVPVGNTASRRYRSVPVPKVRRAGNTLNLLHFYPANLPEKDGGRNYALYCLIEKTYPQYNPRRPLWATSRVNLSVYPYLSQRFFHIFIRCLATPSRGLCQQLWSVTAA